MKVEIEVGTKTIIIEYDDVEYDKAKKNALQINLQAQMYFRGDHLRKWEMSIIKYLKDFGALNLSGLKDAVELLDGKVIVS